MFVLVLLFVSLLFFAVAPALKKHSHRVGFLFTGFIILFIGLCVAIFEAPSNENLTKSFVVKNKQGDCSVTQEKKIVYENGSNHIVDFTTISCPSR